MPPITTDTDELDQLRSDNAALRSILEDLSAEVAVLRGVSAQYDAEADEVANLAVERWQEIKALELRVDRLAATNASLRRQLFDMTVSTIGRRKSWWEVWR